MSTTNKVLNLTQYIEDGFEEWKVPDVVNLSAAYDTVNHRYLIGNILELTEDINLTDLIKSMLENSYFYVEQVEEQMARDSRMVCHMKLCYLS